MAWPDRFAGARRCSSWALLGCGVLSSLLYVAANVLGPRRWKPAEPARCASLGALLVALAASDLPAPLFPMHRREALARGEGSRTDTMHIAFTSVNSVLVLLAIAFGSAAGGRRFRLYSIATVLVLVVAGGLTITQAPRLERNLATPWAGVTERVSIGGCLLWQVVLAAALLRRRSHR